MYTIHIMCMKNNNAADGKCLQMVFYILRMPHQILYLENVSTRTNSESFEFMFVNIATMYSKRENIRRLLYLLCVRYILVVSSFLANNNLPSSLAPFSERFFFRSFISLYTNKSKGTWLT